ERFGIGFAFTAAFIAIARALWPGPAALLPWLAAFCITILLIKFGLPTAVGLVLGALGGVAVDFLVNRDER
ncbi:MAG: branched-chain amino acid ABC transporter permease, partial [Pseudomonadota bacterium]